MAVYSIHFSPTGGTKTVADVLAHALSDEVRTIDLLQKSAEKQSFTQEDICFIAVPASGGRVPPKAAERLRTFHANGATAVTVAVFGNRAIDDTLIELYDLALAVGFTVTAGIEAVAEHSLVREFGHGRPNAADKAELTAFAQAIKQKWQANKRTTPTLPGNRPYKEFHASAMSLVVDDTCTNCKRCARECPVEAIPMQNVKTVETDKCFSCMHCVSVCPVGARRQAPHAVAALAERLRERCTTVKPNRLYL